MNKYASVIETLQFAKAEIEKILNTPEDENHRLRLQHRLQVDIDHIGLLHGVGVTEAPAEPVGPAKTIGGKAIVVQAKGKVAREEVEPDDEKLKVLKQHVKNAYETFLTSTTEQIQQLDDLVIRGVAKKAGLNKVTKDNPETISADFINEIKEAITKKDAAAKDFK